MRITFLPNCGLLLSGKRDSVLVDSPNSQHTAFDGLSEEELEKIIAGQPPYDGLRALFFTHRHNDHYDKKRIRCITQTRVDVAAYSANGASAAEGEICAGEFTVRYFTIDHSGAEFADVPHRVLLVECSGKRLYITGDAQWEKQKHLRILQQYAPCAAVWNPNFLTHEEGRELLSLVPKNFIYHLSVQKEDTFGFSRKCRREYEKYGQALRAELVQQYPTVIEL